MPPEPERLNRGWVTAQRREESRLSRPPALAAVACLALAAATLMLGRAGLLNAPLTGLGTAAFTAAAARVGGVIWRGRRDLHGRIQAERRRVAAARAGRESRLAASLAEHARQSREWRVREQAFAGRPRWHAVTLPAEIDRIDVVGGTLSGWSALLTTVAAPRLLAGGQVTVIDLSEGAVGSDLAALAASLGTPPLVWVLPGDLPRFELGAGLPAAELADVLAASVSADPGGGAVRDPAGDHAILGRVLEILGDGASMAQVAAGLRALGQVGDPRADLARGLLTPGELERITGLFGRGAADRVVIERAWGLEARLRVLEQLGAGPSPLPASRLRVVATDRSAGAFGNAVIGTYATVCLTHLLRRARPGRPWRHTLCLAGAERLPGDVLDRLAAACESARTGLVVAHRSIPPHVRERLGRGNAALAVMRLGNAEDAKVASEQIGTEHRFVISQFTDTVGASIGDTASGSYTSTVGSADSWSDSVSVSHTAGRSHGRSRSRPDLAPLSPRAGSQSGETSESTGTSDSQSLTNGINTSTSWGLTTSRTVGTSESAARTAQRSREFLVEPHELQRLPPSAVIVSYASHEGRQVVLADVNPAIAALSTAAVTDPGELGGSAEPGGAGGPPPNVGPPPEPLDWRTRRRRRRWPG